MEIGGSVVQGHPWLRSKFEISLGYNERFSHRNKKGSRAGTEKGTRKGKRDLTSAVGRKCLKVGREQQIADHIKCSEYSPVTAKV